MAKKFQPTQSDLEYAELVQQQFSQDRFDQPLQQEVPLQFGDEEQSGLDRVLNIIDPLGTQRALVRGVGKGVESLGKAGMRTLPERPERSFGQFLEEQIPLEDTTLRQLETEFVPEQFRGGAEFLTSATERGGEILPAMLGGKSPVVENVVRSMFAGASGETAKKLGFDSVGQLVAELPFLLGPNIFSEKITPKEVQEEIVKFAREKGLSEKQIAPLLSEEIPKVDLLSKISPKGKRVEKILEGARRGKDELFSHLERHPEAEKIMDIKTQNELFNELNPLLKKLDVSERELIRADLQEFIKGNRSLKEAENIYRDINKKFGHKGGKNVQILKRPIKNAIEKTSDSFARDFNLSNDLASRFYKVRKRLTPTEAEKIADQVLFWKAPTQAAYGIMTGNVPLMIELLGEQGARILSQEMLVNPKFANMSQKMMTAVKNNNVALAKQTWNRMTRQFLKDGVDQDIIDQLQDIDIEDFLKEIDFESLNLEDKQ